MNQTILLGIENTFSIKTNRVFHIVLGVIFCANGIVNLMSSPAELLGKIIGSLLLFSGVLYLFYSFFLFSKRSKHAPKVFLSEDIIQIKKSFWKPAKQLKWSDTLSIDFKSYEIVFQLKTETFNFSYNTNSDTSIQIKRAIRSFAESKNIEVIAG